MSVLVSLLLALHALAALWVAIVLLVIRAGVLACRVLIPLLLVVGTQEASFSSVSHVDVGRLLRGKGLLNTLYRLLRQALREGYLENYVKIAEIVGLLVEGQTLVLDSLDLLGFDDLTWVVFDSDFTTVQMGQNEVHTSQCLV